MMRRKTMVGGFAAVAAASVAGITAFACTPLPTLNASQPYGAPGTRVQLTGTTWAPWYGTVQLHWDSLNGPVLAERTPDASMSLAPITVVVPSNAQPGYHAIVATAPRVPASTTRVLFQVIPSGAGTAQAPRVALPATTGDYTGVAAGTVAAIGAVGAAGLLLFGAGVTTLARSYRRVPAARSVRSR